MLRWILAAIHLLALGIGLGAVWARGRALRQVHDGHGLRRVFEADAWWGVAALLWLGSGLWRWLGGTEKATAYYTGNHIFWGKMALFILIVLFSVINWRLIGGDESERLTTRLRRRTRKEQTDAH